MAYIVAKILSLAIRLAYYAVWAYVILSWVGRTNPKLWNFYCKLSRYIEPVLGPIRKLLMPLTYKIGLDFSPYVLALAINFIGNILIRIVYKIFY